MMSNRIISYAQRFEDLHLLRCFGERSDGFYIDIGSGHPVYDNSSLLFYLRGWHGVTVEPNPALARLTRAVRTRDRHIEALVGASAGSATFYLVDDYHGLSTMIEDYARSALREFAKTSQALDFLKVDVEGAEADVLLNGDWGRFRPRVIVVEALAPYTLMPAWESWEPFLTGHGYRHIWFDSLNRYYLAEEAADLARRFEGAPASFDDAFQFRNVKPADTDPAHPDHRLGTLLAGADMVSLPLLERDRLCELLTADIAPGVLEQPAGAGDVARVSEFLLGPDLPVSAEILNLPLAPRLRDVYAAIIDSERFRIACGRISASYSW